MTNEDESIVPENDDAVRSRRELHVVASPRRQHVRVEHEIDGLRVERMIVATGERFETTARHSGAAVATVVRGCGVIAVRAADAIGENVALSPGTVCVLERHTVYAIVATLELEIVIVHAPASPDAERRP